MGRLGRGLFEDFINMWEVGETTIPSVVRIHNAVIERGCSEVQRRERDLHGNENPRLVKFMGQPNDTPPRRHG